jgi:uncharacterized SAM-binding protein YcdF (DUF218 family)
LDISGSGIAPPDAYRNEAIQTIYDFLACIDGAHEPLKPADVILVFGHWHSGPAHHAAKLHHGGFAKRIIVSGGVGPKTRPGLPETYKTEADYFFSILTHNGVPGIAVTRETRATNTLENVRFGIEEYRNRCGKLPQSAILVALPPLLRRSQATMKRHWPGIETQTSPYTPGALDWPIADWLPALRAEVKKLTTYAEKGDIAPVPIPDEVKVAEAILDAELTEEH